VEALELINLRPQEIARLRTGPLAGHIDGFAAWLASQGYRDSSRQRKLRAAARLGQWLTERSVRARAVNETLVTEFIHRARRRRLHYRNDGAAAASLLRYLREIGVVRSKAPAPDSRGLSAIEHDYERHLVRERGLDPCTVRYHLYHVHRLLLDCLGPGNRRVEELSYEGITRYIVRHVPASLDAQLSVDFSGSWGQDLRFGRVF